MIAGLICCRKIIQDYPEKNIIKKWIMLFHASKHLESMKVNLNIVVVVCKDKCGMQVRVCLVHRTEKYWKVGKSIDQCCYLCIVSMGV